MADEVAGTVPAQVMRWVEAGPTVLDSVRGMLREHTKLKMIVEATQDECERLRHQDAQLRAEIRRLTAEAERVHKERAESAQWFAAMMNEASGRLRGEHSPAGSGGHQ
jgi:predicted nuclease with TOPRIM domain